MHARVIFFSLLLLCERVCPRTLISSPYHAQGLYIQPPFPSLSPQPSSMIDNSLASHHLVLLFSTAVLPLLLFYFPDGTGGPK